MQTKERVPSESKSSHRFVRKTDLAADEYRKNFLQIDRETITTITSPEADRVTPLMGKIYLQLVNAPTAYWEREGVLRIGAQRRGEGKSLNAWAALCALLGVASATANKALSWMHDVGVIGYFAGKNGVGIRIFLNRAASSIGTRKDNSVGTRKDKKILAFPPASPLKPRTSRNEAAFKDSYAILEVSDSDYKPSALKSSADRNDGAASAPGNPTTGFTLAVHETQSEIQNLQSATIAVSVNEIMHRLRIDLESSLEITTRRAARQEHERTRDWLESRGLPKAARVAQREAYNVLRKYGLINEKAAGLSPHGEVGRSHGNLPGPHKLTDDEIIDLAGGCVAILETKGSPIEVTLSEMSAEAGGFLLPEDRERVRDRANSLASACKSGGGK